MLFSLTLSAASYLPHMSFLLSALCFVPSLCHSLSVVFRTLGMSFSICCVSFLLHLILLFRTFCKSSLSFCRVCSFCMSFSYCVVSYFQHVILFLLHFRTFGISFSFRCVLYLQHVILFLLRVRTFGMSFSLFLVWVLNLSLLFCQESPCCSPHCSSLYRQQMLTTDVHFCSYQC